MAEFACGIKYYFLRRFKRFFWSLCTITRISVSLFVLFTYLFNEEIWSFVRRHIWMPGRNIFLMGDFKYFDDCEI